MIDRVRVEVLGVEIVPGDAGFVKLRCSPKVAMRLAELMHPRFCTHASFDVVEDSDEG